MKPSELAKWLEKMDSDATPGPWCVETSGEKGDGSELIGVAYGPDDEECERPLAGRLMPFDRAGEEVEYYRDELVAECEHRNRNPGNDSALIVALRNAVPTILLTLRHHDALVEALRSLVNVATALRRLNSALPLNATSELLATIERETGA